MAALATALVFSATGPVHADPTPSAIEQQIDQQWGQLEKVIEDYNKTTGDLRDNKAKAAQLESQLAPLRKKVDDMYARVGAISSSYYKDGRTGTLNALIDSGTPSGFVDQLTTLDRLAKHERDAIREAIAAKDDLDAKKKPLDALIVQQASMEKDLADKKTKIQGDVDSLQKQRTAAYAKDSSVPCPISYVPATTPAGKAVKAACSVRGAPYVWAAEGPKYFDCSGLILWAWKFGGVTLRHYTGWQRDDTAYVKEPDLIPGDLVFYGSDLHHVGMYIGNGYVLHAPTSGDVVKVSPMRQVGSINSFGRPRT